jgi:hypothetical protein
MAISPRLATSTLRNTAGSSLLRGLRQDSAISAERYRAALDRTRANATRVGYQGDVRHHRHPAGMPPFPPAYAAAFADGRRLREEAHRRRRVAGRPYDHRHHARGRVVFALVAVLVALTIASDGGVLLIGGGMLIGLATIAWILVLLASPMLVVAGIVIAVTRTQRRSRLRRGGAAGTAPLPARPAAPPRPDLVWAHARRRFDGLRSAYAAYECDPMAVLRLPALADVSVPSTARFVDAFAEAQALDTDAFPGGTHAPAFVAAVDRAERAWHAARQAAERIRLSGLSPVERSTVERVIKLLTTARDSDNDAERIAAYSRARSELAKLDKAGVIHVPLPATAALDAAARGALPA